MIFMGKSNSGDSSFRIYNSQDIEQGIAIHAGRTAEKYQCLYR